MKQKLILLYCLSPLTCIFAWGGDMYVLGLNSAGQLGDGRASTTAEPVLVAEDVVDVSMGRGYSLFIKRNGSLWGMGVNQSGQLGLDPKEIRSTEFPVGIAYNIAAVSAGYFHTLALNELGQLLATGDDGFGQTGLQNGDTVIGFEQVAVGARSISAGAFQSFFIKPDSTLWGMGSNYSGSLGVSGPETTPEPIFIDEGVVKVSAGVISSLYLKGDGEVWGMGRNYANKLGLYNTDWVDVPTLLFSGAMDIFTGSVYSMIVRADGTLWGVGQNDSGCLGLGDENPRDSWTYVTDGVKRVFGWRETTYFIREDDSLWGMGDGESGVLGTARRTTQPHPVKLMDEVAKVSVGKSSFSSSSLLLKKDGSLWALGDNRYGQLGIELGINRSDPYLLTREVKCVATGGAHGLLLKEDGGLWGMGENSHGELGMAKVGEFAVPQYLAGSIQTVDAGRDHTLLLTVEGVLKSSGLNDEGQLGDGTFTDRYGFVTVDAEVVAVSAGRLHSLYLKEDGRLFGMGQNKYGQLGQGDTTARTVPVLIAENVVAMAAGGVHSLFITNDGELYGCGSNANGELGLGDVEESLEPVLIAEDVLSVSAGYYHTVYVTEDHGLWGMGDNANRALGLSGLDSVRIPVELVGPVKDVVAGWSHTLVVDFVNDLYGTGYNFYGELGGKPRNFSGGWHKIASSVSTFDAGEKTTYYVVSDFWNGWAVRSTGDVQTETGFSWMNVSKDPWIWVYNLGRYAYLLPQVERNSGNWLYLPSDYGTNLQESWDALVPDAEGDVLWEAGLGWVNISRAPWVYSYTLKTYLYMAQALLGEAGVWVYSQAGVKNPIPEKGGGMVPFTKDVVPMVRIPAGSFAMGDAFGEGNSNELPVHTVELSAYWMGETEVTWGQWQEVRDWAIMSGYLELVGIGSGKGDEHPVYDVSWYDVVKWCNAASELAGLEPVYYENDGGAVYRTGEVEPFIDYTKNGYRLPTEAEWEKAARGGLVGKRFPWGDTISHAEANVEVDGFHPDYDDGDSPYTSPAKSFAVNGYGLYDVVGNLREWCADWMGGYYGSSPGVDPTGPESGSVRVIRGGSWTSGSSTSRVSFRGDYRPSNGSYFIGFRVSRR